MFSLLLVLAPLAFVEPDAARESRPATASIQGTVRDRDSGQPLAGVELMLVSGQSEVVVHTNADGNYAAALPPGVLWGRFGRLPNGYARPLMAFPQPLIIEISETPTELPVIELARGRKIEGEVVDVQGRPVAGAQVRAAWHAFEAWMDTGVNGPKWVTAQSDANGEFVLPGIDEELRYKGIVREIELRLFARLANRSSDSWQAVPRPTEAPIALRIGDVPAVALGGQVCDLAGRGVADAEVAIWSKPLGVHGLSCGSPALFDGCDDLRTDAEGRFCTPRQLPVRARYRAVVSAEGYLPESTAWLLPSDEAHAAFDAIKLRRLRTVTGRVIDPECKPVSGARVFQAGDGPHTEASTDAGGRFELPEVAEGRACLFVERQGYRFHGVFTDQAADIELAIEHSGTTPEATESLKSLPANVLPRDEELALARRVLQPFVERAFHERPADAERVLGMLRDRYQRGVYAVRVCHRMAPVDHERAVRLAQAIDNPYQRAYALGLMAESCAAADAAQAQAWLEESFALLARLGSSGEERFAGPVTAAEIAAALLPAVEAVDPHLVREHLWRTLAMRPARALPPRGWRDEAGTTATVAMLVARYDRTIARSLLEPLAERAPALISDGGLLGGNIIAAAAMIDPLWAEQIVLSLSDERRGESQSEQEQARQHLARLLSYRPEVRWRQILGGYTGLWVVGTFDNNYYAEF